MPGKQGVAGSNASWEIIFYTYNVHRPFIVIDIYNNTYALCFDKTRHKPHELQLYSKRLNKQCVLWTFCHFRVIQLLSR